MPNRMIRDGLLESEAVLSLPAEGRWLYVAILLSADDVGLFEATQFKLSRRADLKPDLIPRLLAMLVDLDLVRLYQGAGMRTFGFIPKFAQRLQIKRARYPLPPLSLLEGDEDATNKIKHLAPNPTVDDGGSPISTVGQQPEPEPEPEKKREIRRRGADLTGQIVEAYHQELPTLPQVRVMGKTRAARIKALSSWVLSSKKPDGTPRAETPEQCVEWFRAYFRRAASNDFLMGRTARSESHANWRADIDFLVSEKGVRHVIEKTEAA